MLSLEEILFDEESHVYLYKGKRFDSVTQVIRLAGLGDDFSMVPADRMEYARRRGRLVHMCCQYIDEGTLDMKTVDPGIRGYIEAYLLFRSECKVKPIAIEKRMIHEGIGLAGTPDLICFLNGRRSVIDRKTSQHMSKSMGLQTAGYKHLWEALESRSMIYDRYGLRLENTGRYKLIPHEDADDISAFRDILAHAKSLRCIEPWIRKYGK